MLKTIFVCLQATEAGVELSIVDELSCKNMLRNVKIMADKCKLSQVQLHTAYHHITSYHIYYSISYIALLYPSYVHDKMLT